MKSLDDYLREKYSERSQTGYRYGIRLYLKGIGGAAAALDIDYGGVLG